LLLLKICHARSNSVPGSLGWSFPTLNFFQIKYTEAILSNGIRKLLWFEITKMLTVVLKIISLLFIIIFGALSFPAGHRIVRRLRHRCKNDQIKIKKNVCKRNKKTLPLISVVQLHARCPRNGLQGNSEYAIQFSFAETVVVLGWQ